MLKMRALVTAASTLALMIGVGSQMLAQVEATPETDAVIVQPVAQPVSLFFEENELIGIPLTFACPSDFAGYLPPQIQVGTVGAVVTVSDLRALPDYRGAVLGVATPGAQLTRIIAGPACSTGYVWWLVEVEGLIGWTPESSQAANAYWISGGVSDLPLPESPADATAEVAMPLPAAEDLPLPEPQAEATAEAALPVPPIEVVSEPDLRIDYTKFGITMVNVADEAIPLGSMTFTSDSGTYNATEWGINSLSGGDCVQLYYNSSSRPTMPSDCSDAASWISRGSPNILFWQAEFTILIEGVPVGTCRPSSNNDVDLVSCDIAID